VYRTSTGILSSTVGTPRRWRKAAGRQPSEGITPQFTIDVNSTTDWLFFAIDLPPCGWSEDRALKLLAANAPRLLVKFAIGVQGNLVLRTERPVEGLTYSYFVDCLGALSHYADAYCGGWLQK
jgi:hypothetical protein